MELDLAGVDRGKEIAPYEGEQHAAEYQNQSRHRRHDESAPHQSRKQIGLARAKTLEPAVKPHVEAREPAARSVRFAVMLALQEIADQNRRQRPGQCVGREHGENHRKAHRREQEFGRPNTTEVKTQLIARVETSVGTAMFAEPWSVA